MRIKSNSRLVFTVFLLIAAGLQFSLWFGENSIATLKQIHLATAAEFTHNEELRKRNNILKAEVIDLKSGEETMEERARMELGYVRDGEFFYRIIESDVIPSVSSQHVE